MELPGIGYNIEILIENTKRIPMRDLDFSLSFYTKSYQRVKFRKSDLIHVAQTDGDLYYALLDTARVGAGELMCDVSVSDPEPRWQNGVRPILLRKYTGKNIGTCQGYGRGHECQAFEQGYRVTFNFVDGLPKPEVAYIFYGHLVNQLTSYSEITSDMLVSPENHIVSVSAGKMGKTSCGLMEEGDKVVVLIPVDTDYTAAKDNGFGAQMPFDTSIMGSNGENIVTIDGIQYRAYGEMMTTEGEMFIYVN